MMRRLLEYYYEKHLGVIKMIEVKELEDNTFEISWDENDPLEKILNDWTEEDFINCIKKYLNDLKE